jgi:hypothetical protein
MKEATAWPSLAFSIMPSPNRYPVAVELKPRLALLALVLRTFTGCSAIEHGVVEIIRILKQHTR